MTKWTYDRKVTESDLTPMSRLILHAFATPPEMTSLWLRNAGLEQSRVMRSASGAPEACLLRIPMGHFYGGRSVPALGIAGVAVAPERRGKGLGRDLMRACILEAAEEGWAISSLYASTQSLYRQVGFEQSGYRFCTKFSARDFELARGDDGWKSLEVRPLADGDVETVKRCYHAFGSRHDGVLDRGPYCWGRVWNLRGDPHQGFGAFSGKDLEGYVYLHQKRNPVSGRHDVHTTDVVFTTARAGRALAKFLGGFATTADEVYVYGGPLHPIVPLLDQQRYSVERKDYWMIRVVDVAKALATRGWAPGVNAETTLELRDDLVGANAGTWKIRVRDGRAEASRGSSGGAIRLDARGMAAIYSGMFSATQAALAGLVEGDASAIAAADAIFPGGCPWMIEMF